MTQTTQVNVPKNTCGIRDIDSVQNGCLKDDLSKCLVLGYSGLILPFDIVAPVRFSLDRFVSVRFAPSRIAPGLIL